MNNLFLNLYIKFQILMDREDGQDMVEYALAVALIALAAVAGVRGMAGGISTAFGNIGTKLGASVA
jgi:pilus assembly protein Flp/PilA